MSDSSGSWATDSSSDRSYRSEHYDPVCIFRTPRFHDQECSRYFDCPTHIVERARTEIPDSEEEENSADDDEEEEEEEHDQEHDQEHHHTSGNDDEGGLANDSEGAPESEHHSLQVDGSSPSDEEGMSSRQRDKAPEHVRAGHEVIDLTASSPEAGPSNAAESSSSPVHGVSQHEPEVVDLTEDTPPPEPTAGSEVSAVERALPTIPTPGSGSSVSSWRAAVAESPSGHRRPITPPSPPPPIRRRTSATNFGPAPRSTLAQPQRPSEGRRPSDIILPRWQPDAEVTFCPICHTQFSIFVRKHHCRKCGRVVCASCSPHRITIPYQYIVVPPGAQRPGLQRYPPSLISGEGGYADFSNLGGGERVRLCNPCVPDPNTNPPQSQGSPNSLRGHGRSQSSFGSGLGFGPNMVSGSRPPPYYSGRADEAFGRNRSVTMLPSGSRLPSGSHSYQSTHNRILSGTPPSHYPYAVSPSSGYRRRPGLESGQPSTSSTPAHRRPLPPDPPQLAEEDECPVCHRELPPRNLPNFEAQREAHINTCITSHSTYGGTPTGEGSSRPRRTGMFPYDASEKDCIDSAECTICLEEFVKDVRMARLECLCRFHYECISRWFAKNPGRCPVHSHDSHGF